MVRPIAETEGLIELWAGIVDVLTSAASVAVVSVLLYRPSKLGDRMQVMAPPGLESGAVESLSLG